MHARAHDGYDDEEEDGRFGASQRQQGEKPSFLRDDNVPTKKGGRGEDGTRE